MIEDEAEVEIDLDGTQRRFVAWLSYDPDTTQPHQADINELDEFLQEPQGDNGRMSTYCDHPNPPLTSEQQQKVETALREAFNEAQTAVCE